MKKYLVFLAAALLQADAWAATYTYTGPAYSPPDLHNFTSCPPGTGNCGAYTTAMAQTGSFTTAAPLPSNLNSQDITAQLTSYSFSDGLTTYSSGDPQVTLVSVSATTTGGVLDFSVHLVRWQTPAPHVIGDHLDQVLVTESGQHNAVCGNIQVNPQGDSCGTSNAGGVFSSWTDASSTVGSWTVTGLPPVATNAVPTLGEWGLLLLALLMISVGWMTMGRRRM
ncbi:IPTL-CTERM sorting domain-containing protein [Acidovorax sp. JMULE5]|jgi:hypothetical protein|uniref:IPTL-CTERM sorting domain-containing protein n=1 Tax=Acidovorax sp. JMULE5 TaxID=2518343 RepID=UPI0015A33FFA|nr:IPTL-CTERM sorting domain-containing protein [Acidovorax sp. JMULE5]QLA82593.1 IPTL-CTERM sorting domain-containing protein [Acidovorax sp. JMULE5]